MPDDCFYALSGDTVQRVGLTMEPHVAEWSHGILNGLVNPIQDVLGSHQSGLLRAVRQVQKASRGAMDRFSKRQPRLSEVRACVNNKLSKSSGAGAFKR